VSLWSRRRRASARPWPPTPPPTTCSGPSPPPALRCSTHARARAHTHTHARDALSSGMRMTHYTQAHFKSRRRSRPVDRADEAGPPHQSLRRVSASFSRHSSSSHAPPRPRLVALQVACHVHRAAITWSSPAGRILSHTAPPGRAQLATCGAKLKHVIPPVPPVPTLCRQVVFNRRCERLPPPAQPNEAGGAASGPDGVWYRLVERGAAADTQAPVQSPPPPLRPPPRAARMRLGWRPIYDAVYEALGVRVRGLGWHPASGPHGAQSVMAPTLSLSPLCPVPTLSPKPGIVSQCPVLRDVTACVRDVTASPVSQCPVRP
jgi:hypothetical protein